MKFQSPQFAVLTLILVGLLPAGCKTKGTNTPNTLMKAYTLAKDAQDYPTAASLLVQLVAADSAKNAWAYDSLAFYNYFYLYNPGVVRNSHTAKYYAQMGLNINPSNNFLLEIKAKMDLEDQQVDIAQASFRNLWGKTNDYTYWWILSFIEAHANNNYARADSMIATAMADPAVEKKTVRMEHIQERIRETVPAKAAFLYLKSTTYMVQKRFQEAADLLKQALEIAPDFYAAKRSIYEMQQGAAPQR